MTATTIPPGLASHRVRMMAKTGLSEDAYGIAPDESHKASGGYHCGQKDCENIDRYHPPATSHIGSTTEDYSERLLRDRLVGGNMASAEDIGDDWPNGGRDAWLRFNNLFVHQLQAGDPELGAIREVNFSPDGTARKRWDAEHPLAGVNADGIISSTDSVYMHTHVGFYRDTEGTPLRARTLRRIEQIADAAIANRPLPSTEEDDMGASFGPINVELVGFTSLAIPPVEEGAADPRSAYVNAANDTGGRDYALRFWFSRGLGWEPLTSALVNSAPNGAYVSVPSSGGVYKLKGQQRLSAQLKKGTYILSVSRMAIDATGQIVTPTEELPAYDGHLTVCIERGPVVH